MTILDCNKRRCFSTFLNYWLLLNTTVFACDSYLPATTNNNKTRRLKTQKLILNLFFYLQEINLAIFLYITVELKWNFNIKNGKNFSRICQMKKFLFFLNFSFLDSSWRAFGVLSASYQTKEKFLFLLLCK